jgi:hypothetical protein
MKMMNERIKELADQATDKEHGYSFFDREKFAELIVRECVKVMYDNAIERKVGLDIDKRPTYYAAAILEHFGAKE